MIDVHIVKVGLIDHIESAHKRLLNDGAKKIATMASSAIKSGITTQEIEVMISDTISKFLKPLKSKVRNTSANV